MKKIGVLVPSSNTTTEPEFTKMNKLNGNSLHFARIPITHSNLDGLLKMNEGIDVAAKHLSDANVDAIAYACTSGSFYGGAGTEKKISNKISNASNGTPGITTSESIYKALKSLNAQKITVVTPYIDDLNSREKQFLEEYGFDVLKIQGLGILDNLIIGKQTPEIAHKLVKDNFDPDSEAVFISCTNFSAIEAIEKLEEELNVPVFSSNSCTFWNTIRTIGINDPIKGYGRLLEI